MALNINGTTGISGVDGSASAPALTGTDSNTGINFGTDIVNINTAGTERARVDANGAFHIKSAGTSYNDFTGSSDAGLVIGSSSNSNSGVMIRTGTSGTGRLNFGDGDGSSADRSRGFISYLHSSNALTFGSDASERMRIDSSGSFLVGRTGTINVDSQVCNHVFEQLSSSNFALGVHANNSTQRGIGIYYTSGNTASDFLFCEVAGSIRFELKGNGGLANIQSNDVNLSDVSVKKNITDAASTIDQVKQWKIKEFHLTDDEDSDDKRFGVVAQDMETVDPKLVTEYGSNLKGVKEQQIYWKAIKSLQEAIAKIEVLETKVAALEAG